MMKKTIIIGASILVLPLICAAQDTDFSTSLSIGTAITDGNSKTLQANASLITEGEKAELGSIRAGIEANYGKSKIDGNDETTMENAKLFSDLKKTLTPRTFASLSASAFYDDVASIDYRAMISPGAGMYLIKDDITSFYIEAGPAYIWENVAGKTDNYFALRFAERIQYLFSPTAKVWQSLEYMPRADSLSDNLLSFELGAEVALNSYLNLRLVLQNNYNSKPAEGLKKNDMLLVGGISFSF